MKKLVLPIILSIVLSLCNCNLYSQIHISTSGSLINFMVGNWIWTGSRGGFSGDDISNPSSVGYTKSYTYRKITGSTDSLAYSFFKNDSLIKSGKTKISSANSMYGNEWNLESIVGFGTNKMTVVIKSNESITMYDNCYDCYSHGFVRNKITNYADLKLVDNDLLVYPTPGRNYIQFKWKNLSAIEKLTVYDINGIMVKEYRNLISTIDISALSTGVYFVELINGKESIRTKFVKE